MTRDHLPTTQPAGNDPPAASVGTATGAPVQPAMSVADAPPQLTPLVSAQLKKMPWGVKWRSSGWFITAVVCGGIVADIIAYAIVTPILPYRLQALHYDQVSALTSWLMFAYSGGIFVATFPVAFYFHRYPYRRGPLVIAVLVMEASFVLFMLGPTYYSLLIARAIQGAASAVVWTVGFALICENIDPAHLGAHLGFAFSGVSIAVTIAPPIGGALYQHMGWYAPFIFCIIINGVDLVARMLVVEQRWVRQWKADNATILAAQAEMQAATRLLPEQPEGGLTPKDTATKDVPYSTSVSPTTTTLPEKPKELSPWGVVVALASLPRGTVAFLMVFVFGFIVGEIDTTLTLHVQRTWNKDPDFVGLVYLAAAAPTFFVGPIAGHLADKWGAETVLVPVLVYSLPWLPLMTRKSSLPAFIVFFALTKVATTLLNSIASLEMALVSKHKEGISEIHEFAALNLAFALASAAGSVAGGQVYEHVKNGWELVCWLGFAAFAVCIVPTVIWTGARPVMGRFMGWKRRKQGGVETGEAEEEHAAELERMDTRTHTATLAGVAAGPVGAAASAAEVAVSHEMVAQKITKQE